MPNEVLSLLVSSGALGAGALGGSAVIVIFLNLAINELKEMVSGIANKLDSLATGHEVTKVKNGIEIDNLRAKILEIERRLDRLEAL